MTGENAIAIINAGSSSIKFSLFAENDTDLSVILNGQIEGLYTDAAHFIVRDPAGATLSEKRWSDAAIGHEEATRYLLDYFHTHRDGRHVDAVGHRIVHGGTEFAAPVQLDAAVLARLEKLVPLAPLHQPHNLAPARAVFAAAPHLFQVGCFDTAFHAYQNPLAQAFALPVEITDRGVRRYGFHGLSYEYIASVLPTLDPDLAQGKVIVAHLGNGASLCAIDAGRSVANTMGFTAVDGLPMGTRSGSLDPGVIIYLIDEFGMNARDIETLLYKKSGLLGVSGISSDMRTLEASDNPRAHLAIDLFIYRVGREIGSLTAALGGLDAIIFTAGIGEHSVSLRSAVCRGAAWLGVVLDEVANAAGATRISTSDSRVSAWVVPTNEELMIARQTRHLLAQIHPLTTAEGFL